MTRSGITFEQVELAAEKILLEGFTPTIEKIRQTLGGTGSNSTIAKYLNEWKTRRLTATRHDLPASTMAPDPVNAAVNRVWQQIREESAKEIETIKDQFAQQMSALQAETTILRAESEDLTTSNTHLQSHLHAITGERELLAVDLRQCKQDIALLQERELSLKTQLQQAKSDASTTITELKHAHERELDAYNSQIEIIRQDHKQLISTLKDAQESERHRYMALLDKARTEEIKQIENNKLLQERLNQYAIQLNEAQSTQSKAISEAESAVKREATLRAAIADVVNNNQQQLTLLTQQLSKNHAQIEQAQATLFAEMIKQRDNRQSLEEKITNKLSDLASTWTNRLCKETP